MINIVPVYNKINILVKFIDRNNEKALVIIKSKKFFNLKKLHANIITKRIIRKYKKYSLYKKKII